MTETEWITTKMPLYMLREYPSEWDGRKVRLFWCACLRRAWNQLTDERTQRLVEEVERQPEKNAEWFVHERSFAFENYNNWSNRSGSGIYYDCWAFDAFLGTSPGTLIGLARFLADRAVEGASSKSSCNPGTPEWTALRDKAEIAEKTWQSDMLREIFGNPFRSVSVTPWLTADVLALARGIYEDGAFDRMPILADALQDAGCDNINVLDHCREPGEHVRGCWVIDLLTGRK